jgi:hypothetical protein
MGRDPHTSFLPKTEFRHSSVDMTVLSSAYLSIVLERERIAQPASSTETAIAKSSVDACERKEWWISKQYRRLAQR